MKTYLEPLKKETFLSNTEINALFGNIQEIFGFQQQFLQTLENALETEAQFHNLDSPSQFKVGYLIISSHSVLLLFVTYHRIAYNRYEIIGIKYQGKLGPLTMIFKGLFGRFYKTLGITK